MLSWQEFLTQNCTEKQAEAVEAKEPLIVVSAGAGAGKTQTLARRFAYLIASDPQCKMEQMLVLTFTKKAAQEMKSRIERQLKELYENYADQLPHLKERLLQIDDATISTLDSFAMKITREAGLSLDIDPAFNIAPEPFEELFWSNFARALDEMSVVKMKRLVGQDELWQKRVEELFATKNFSKILSKYTPEKLAQAAKQAAELYANSGMEIGYDWLWNFSNSETVIEHQKELKITDEIWFEWHNFFTLFDSYFLGNTKSENKLMEFRTKWLEKEKTQENIDAFAQEIIYSVIKGAAGNHIKQFFSQNFACTAKDYRDKRIDQLKFLQKQTMAEIELCCTLNKIAALGWYAWEVKKHAANCLSIHDLMINAQKVVSSSEAYKHKFKHIMVDEFQDTNPLQDRLLKQLWCGLDAENPNNLFLVGDLKQSIYRFRYAEPKLFEEYIKLAQNSGKKAHFISMLENFRSTAQLINIVNSSFGKLWEKGIGSLEYPYEDLKYPKTSRAKSDDDSIDIITVTKQADEKIYPKRLELYTALARYITSLIAENSNLSWRDFTILTMAKTPFNALQRAFETEKIPYTLCAAKDYYGRDEIIILINLLNLLANPDDPYALSAWLASPFCDLNPGETEEMLCEASNRTAYGETLKLREVTRERHPEITARLEKLSKIARLRGISSVLMELQKDNNFLKNYFQENRRQVSLNISMLIKATSEYEATEGSSLAGCAKYLYDAVINQQTKEEPEQIDDSQNKIRVMTIHASKGLEFKRAILIETSKEKFSKSNSIIVSKEFGLIVNEFPEYLETPGQTTVGYWYKKLEKEARDEETQRCWYVALTRAQQKLTFCGINNIDKETTEIKRTGFLKLFTELQQDNPQINEFTADDIPQYPKTESATVIKEPLQLTDETDAMLSRITASAYAQLQWCPYAYRRSFRQGLQMDWENEGNGETAANGQSFGNLVHALMRRWDFNKTSLDSLFDEKILLKLPADLREEFSKSRNDTLLLLENFAETDDGKKLATIGDKVYKETPFRVYNGELLLVGAIDLYWEDADGLHLRDWKTGSENEMTTAYYAPQLDFYAAALWLAGIKKERQTLDSRIIHLREPESGETKIYTDDELRQISERIINAAKLATSNSFPPATEKCAQCPWKESCNKRV